MCLECARKYKLNKKNVANWQLHINQETALRFRKSTPPLIINIYTTVILIVSNGNNAFGMFSN